MHGISFIQDLAVILVVAVVVGWLCQRIGLSVIVGFLVAGMVVGPFTPPFSLVTNVERIETLSQLGLVFLMFAIGLGLSVRKLRRLGFTLFLATATGAVLMYYLTRLLGVALGQNATESLFMAGMLMVSSSAIIGKILHETGANNERAGQLAMGISVLEDVVAVVMLTLLTSLVPVGGGEVGAGSVGVGATLWRLGAFVALAGLGGLLLVPWVLQRMSRVADEELQTLGLAALLFSLAVLAQRAGYSLALGAFLLGMIVAETQQRNQVERTFAGMRDVFSAVFFVSIGMQIDPRALWAEAGLIVGVTVFVWFARPLVVTVGLVMVGTAPKDALRTGLTGTPIGEFSFIIAQLGVGAALVPAKFYPVAVGVSLLTTLVAPGLTRHSAWIADWVLARQPSWLAAWQGYYYGWLERFRREQLRNQLWQLSRARFGQIGVEILGVSGLLLFSGQLLEVVEGWLGRDWGFVRAPQIVFWTGLGLVLLIPLVAIWRNFSALALLYAQVSTEGHPRAAQLAPLIEGGLKSLAGAVLFFWLVAMLPVVGAARWWWWASAGVVVVTLLFMRTKLIYWHSQMEVELHSLIEEGGGRMSGTTAPWLQSHGDWQVQLIDCTLPDLADCQGRSIEDLRLRTQTGCSVVGIERQGYMITLPSAKTVFYPRDKVLLMGTPEQVWAGKKILGAVSGTIARESLFEEVRMEVLIVVARSPAVGRTLGELSLTKSFGVQITGLQRGNFKVLNPRAEDTVQAGDQLLVLGALAHVRTLKAWINEPRDERLTGA
jgi:CPA2 family monovalent cation:H+ antiporter-2